MVSISPPLTFLLKLLVLITSTDDFEYQSAFAALDELRLGKLKPFFKEQCLQVTEMMSYDCLNTLSQYYCYLPKNYISFHIYQRAVCGRKKTKIDFSTSATLCLTIREIHS